MKIFGFYIARELPEKIVEVEKIVEKIEFVELGDKVSVYKVRYPYSPSHYFSIPAFPEWHGKIFLSCHQALEECNGAQVEKITAYKSGNRYFTRQGVEQIKVQPKPKVAKGKAT